MEPNSYNNVFEKYKEMQLDKSLSIVEEEEAEQVEEALKTNRKTGKTRQNVVNETANTLKNLQMFLGQKLNKPPSIFNND